MASIVMCSSSKTNTLGIDGIVCMMNLLSRFVENVRSKVELATSTVGLRLEYEVSRCTKVAMSELARGRIRGRTHLDHWKQDDIQS